MIDEKQREDIKQIVQTGRSVMSVMDLSGHLSVTWDPMDPNDVARAKKDFDRLRKQGYLAFRMNLIDRNVKGPEVTTFERWDGELIFEFEDIKNPTSLLMVPAMQGG